MFCGRCYAMGAPTLNNPPRLLDKRVGIHQCVEYEFCAVRRYKLIRSGEGLGGGCRPRPSFCYHHGALKT
jgi:hypothetical protein